MLFKNSESSLKLEIVSYEFPGVFDAPRGERNWLVLRGTYTDEDGRVVRDSGSCLLTSELSEMTAGLKVLKAGIRDRWDSEFSESYFLLSAYADGEDRYVINVSFALLNTLEDIDCADIACVMTTGELGALIGELDAMCKKFPDRD